MVSLDQQNWRPLNIAPSNVRATAPVGQVVREAAIQGKLSQLEAFLDQHDNRQRRTERKR